MNDCNDTWWYFLLAPLRGRLQEGCSPEINPAEKGRSRAEGSRVMSQWVQPGHGEWVAELWLELASLHLSQF